MTDEFLNAIGALTQERDALREALDLMLDEFRRIDVLAGTSEITGICERAAQKIRQRVPLIVQRDQLEARVANAIKDCDMAVALANVFEMERNGLRDELHRAKTTLRKHHLHASEGCNVFFEQDGKPIEIATDLGEAYQESALHDETCAALSTPAPPVCEHDWAWSLRSGEVYGKPCDLNTYDTRLVSGKCRKCGAIHTPAPPVFTAEQVEPLASCLQHIKTLSLECGEKPSAVLAAVGLSACGGVGHARAIGLVREEKV